MDRLPQAIDAVVNLHTPELVESGVEGLEWFLGKMNVSEQTAKGVSVEDLLGKMDRSGVERAILISVKCGPVGPSSNWRLSNESVAETVRRYPDRFWAIAGIDPTEGMQGVRELEHAVKDLGFIGAHLYPHWFRLAPDHARYYPFYAKCVELGVPIQMQVGHCQIYSETNPLPSVGRPITLDTVACDFPDLKLIGIHIGWPWTEEMIAVAYKHPNVYIGADAYAPKYWPAELVHFINTFGQDKVIFGTDFPVIEPERAMKEIGELELRPGPERKLLRENALRAYQLEA